jgi:hypothetical protein
MASHRKMLFEARTKDLVCLTIVLNYSVAFEEALQLTLDNSATMEIRL